MLKSFPFYAFFLCLLGSSMLICKLTEQDLIDQLREKRTITRGEWEGLNSEIKKKKDGMTLLHAAVCNELGYCLYKPKLIQSLISNGLNVRPKDNKGRAPLHIISQFGAFDDSESSVIALDIINILMKAGANVNEQTKKGLTPLHYGLKIGKVRPEIVQCLINQGANVNALDNERKTPLHYAVTSFSPHKLKLVEMLLKHGADVNALDAQGCSPLFYVLYEGAKEIARELIKQGAKVNVCDKKGNTPLYYITRYHEEYNSSREIINGLIQAGADVNALGLDGNTPLVNALIKGNKGYIQILLRAGADFVIKNDQSPLYCLVAYGDSSLHNLSLNKINVATWRDKKGNTLCDIVADEETLDNLIKLISERVKNADNDCPIKDTPLKDAADQESLMNPDSREAFKEELHSSISQSQYLGNDFFFRMIIRIAKKRGIELEYPGRS